jgi:endonuclease YncB( thermonuclease family)
VKCQFHKRLLSVLLIVLLFPALSAAENLAGCVVKIVDGDTVYVVDANRQKHKIRLSGIDALERGLTFGNKVQGALFRSGRR